MYSVLSKQKTQSMINIPSPNDSSESRLIPILSPDTVDMVATAVIIHISIT